MKFSDVCKNATINCMAGVVPCIIGHAGVGKSQLPKAIRDMWIDIANEKKSENDPTRLTKDNFDIVVIFGSLVKEGELGGVPVPVKKKEDSSVDMRYTIHPKLKKVLQNAEEGKMTLLFIDEINRCENAVQQELMQLILDKEINMTKLPEKCAIICAGNPEVDDYADYQVTIMNDALKNRFVQYTMDADTEEWLKWASETNPSTGLPNVHEDLVEFIAEYPNLLHNPKSTEAIKPTPRGVHMFSMSYCIAQKLYSGDELESIILNQAKGMCGITFANTFVSFIRNKENPLVKPEEIMHAKNKEAYNTVLNRIKNEGPLRQFVIVDRLIKYMENMIEKGELSKKNVEDQGMKLNDILDIIPKDSMVGIMKDIAKNHRSLYTVMIETDKFMDVFLDANKMANQSKAS